MDFKTLSKNLIQVKKERDLTSKDWPGSLIINSSILDKVKYIEKLTIPQGLMVSQKGTSGWEYAFTVGFVIDEFYFSKVKSGNYQSVVPELSIRIEPVVDSKKNQVNFNISLGENTTKSKSYKLDNFNKDFAWGIGMVVHTHPRIYFDDKSFQHTFFSDADFNFLRATKVPALALVTKNTIWLACNADSTYTFPEGIMQNLNGLERHGEFDKMLKLIKDELKDCGVIFYYGKFGDKLKRIN